MLHIGIGFAVDERNKPNVHSIKQAVVRSTHIAVECTLSQTLNNLFVGPHDHLDNVRRQYRKLCESKHSDHTAYSTQTATTISTTTTATIAQTFTFTPRHRSTNEPH